MRFDAKLRENHGESCVLCDSGQMSAYAQDNRFPLAKPAVEEVF